MVGGGDGDLVSLVATGSRRWLMAEESLAVLVASEK